MNKKFISAVLVVGVLGFVAGRYLVPSKVETKSVVVSKKVKNVDNHKVTTIVVDKDGKKVTTIVSDTKSGTITDTAKTDESKKDYSVSKTTVSGLVGLNFNSETPVYGISFTKPVLGPLTIGAFGLNNGSAGVSLGLTF